MRYLALIAVFGVLISLSSCKDDTTSPVIPVDSTLVTKTVTMTPDSANDLYFSFDNNAAVPKSGASGTNWDMRINHVFGGGRTQQIDVLFNSGSEYSAGNTKAYVVDTTFDNVSYADAAKCRVDSATTSGRIVGIGLSSSDFFVYNPSTHMIAPNPQKSIVVRTASGAFYKVQVVGMSISASQYELSTFTIRYTKAYGTKLK